MIDLSGSASGRRVLLYSNDTYGSGHLRQSLRLADRLALSNGIDAVLVVASTPDSVELRRGAGVDVITLPAVVEHGASYRSQTRGVPLDDLVGFRGNALGTVIESYQPALILVDEAPVGFEAELWPVLRRFVERRERPRLMLGLRDIVDAADRVNDEWVRLDAWSVVDRLYDRVLVYGDEALTTTATELRLATRLRGRVRHVGYLSGGGQANGVVCYRNPVANDSIDEGPLVVLVTGGEAANTPLLAAYAEFLASASFRSVEVHEADGRAAELIRRATAVVAAADYGTVCSVLAAGIPALLVPRSSPSQEEALRARRLAGAGRIEVVDASDMTADHIRNFVADAMGETAAAVFALETSATISLDGLDGVAAEVAALLAQPATFGPAPAVEPPASVCGVIPPHEEVTGRVGYVVKQFPSPPETPILNELLGLQRAGVDLHLLSLEAPEEDQRRPARLDALTVPLTVVGNSGTSLRTLFDALDTAAGPDGARQARTLLHRLPGPAGMRVLDHALQLADLVRHDGMTRMHAHYMGESAYAAYVAHIVTGVPFSISLHSTDVFRHNVDREAFSEVASTAAVVVVPCDASRRHVVDELMMDRDARVEVINCSAGPLDPRPPAGTPRIGGFVVAVGRLEEKKGFDVLIDACTHLLQQGVDVGCAIVGEGSMRDHLATKIRAAGISERVRLAGALPHEHVLDLLGKATVVAAPCTTMNDGDRDALPTVLLEAMGRGTPAVATPVAGIPELIDDGVDGVLVPGRDAAALADGLRLLLQERATWCRLSEAAAAKVRRDFDPAEAIDRLAAVLGRKPSSLPAHR